MAWSVEKPDASSMEEGPGLPLGRDVVSSETVVPLKTWFR